MDWAKVSLHCLTESCPLRVCLVLEDRLINVITGLLAVYEGVFVSELDEEVVVVEDVVEAVEELGMWEGRLEMSEKLDDKPAPSKNNFLISSICQVLNTGS